MLNARLEKSDPYSTFKKRPLWATAVHQSITEATSSNANAFEEDPYVQAVFSIPTYSQLLDKSMDEISYGSLQIKLKDNVSPDKRLEI